MIGVAVGRYRGVEPRSNVSMIIMRPPQHGHGWGGWSVAAALSGACCLCAVCAFCRSDQLTRPRDGLGLGAAGEQTVVPDPVEPVWQDVDEEPADELVVCETWISLEPGWRVFDGPHATIAVEYVPPRVQ